jgi:hypothetical protein
VASRCTTTRRFSRWSNQPRRARPAASPGNLPLSEEYEPSPQKWVRDEVEPMNGPVVRTPTRCGTPVSRRGDHAKGEERQAPEEPGDASEPARGAGGDQDPHHRHDLGPRTPWRLPTTQLDDISEGRRKAVRGRGRGEPNCDVSQSPSAPDSGTQAIKFEDANRLGGLRWRR